MAIVPKFTQAQIKSQIDNFLRVIEKRIIKRMQYLGEECVILAKSIPKEIGFEDQTTALRSSMGYAVFKDGVAINYFFKEGPGTSKGRDIAKKVALNHKQGILLVVVAGMDYAVKLESIGRDVLTSAELYAKVEAPKMMEALKKNINSAIG